MQTPDYQILLEDMQGNRIELPQQNLPDAGVYACVDCRIPLLMAATDAADIQDVNAFAETLKGMREQRSSLIRIEKVLYPSSPFGFLGVMESLLFAILYHL